MGLIKFIPRLEKLIFWIVLKFNWMGLLYNADIKTVAISIYAMARHIIHLGLKVQMCATCPYNII